MERVKKIQSQGKEILILDYSDCKGHAMINVFDRAVALALEAQGRHCVLNIFNENTFVSPDFMRHVEAVLPQADKVVGKQAIIGLSNIQKWILKGLNLWYHRQIHSFDSMEEAIEFLVAD